MEKQTFEEWQKYWGGRTFKCGITGETFVIPHDVQECDFFSFGKSYVDVGRVGFYCRYGGHPIDITDTGGDLSA